MLLTKHSGISEASDLGGSHREKYLQSHFRFLQAHSSTIWSALIEERHLRNPFLFFQALLSTVLRIRIQSYLRTQTVSGCSAAHPSPTDCPRSSSAQAGCSEAPHSFAMSLSCLLQCTRAAKQKRSTSYEFCCHSKIVRR